jgi:hypothetical protein
MAIRDGISIEIDEERAREEAIQSATSGKRRRKAAVLAASEQGPRRKPSVVLAVLGIIFIFVVASAYAFFQLRQTRPEPGLEIGLDKTNFPLCETINMTVWLVNPSNGILREYELGTTQKFQLEVQNESGDIVAAYNPQLLPGKAKVSVGPGERTSLGTFQWDQTTEVSAGENVTYVQVKAGMYTVEARLYGYPGIWAKRNLVIG